MNTFRFFLSHPHSLLDRCAKAALVGAAFSFPISQAPAYIFMALTLISWLAAGGYQYRFNALRTDAFSWSALALVLLILVGTFYSSGDPEDIQRHVTKYAKLAFIPLAISLLQEGQWRRYCVNAFTLAMSITLFLSMLSLFIEIPFMKGNSGSLEGNHYVFKDHIVQNLMMAFFVLIMLVKGQRETSYHRMLGYWGVALLGVINIIGFVHGRTGYLALALVLGIFVFFNISSRRRWQALLALIMAGSVLLPFSDSFRHRIDLAIHEIQMHEPENVTSVGARIEMTRISLALIGERPILGWGTGSYENLFCERAATEELCAVGGYHPHNQFLSFGVQLGLIGILAYMVFIATAFRQAWRFDQSEKTLALGLLSALLVDSMLHAPLFLVGEAQFFIVMLAVMLAKTNTVPDDNRYGLKSGSGR